MNKKTKILFVCFGNICRSPMAEGVFLNLVEERGIEHKFYVDSCGISDWSKGRSPHEESIRVCKRHGIPISQQKARPLKGDDFKTFDLIVALDEENLRDIKSMPESGKAKCFCLRSYDPDGGDLSVPDPMYGGPKNFERAFEIIYRSCTALLQDFLGE